MVKEEGQMKITLYIPISRENVVDDFFNMLDSMDLPRPEMELIVLVDTCDKKFIKKINDKLAWINRYAEFGRTFSMATGNKPLPKNAHNIERRMRIIENWNLAKKMFGDTKWFFGLEDDTICYRDTFWHLFNTFIFNDGNELRTPDSRILYVEGVQAYRQVDAVGVWKVDKDEAYTLSPKSSGVDPIEGGGFYCFLSYTNLIKKHKFECKNGLFSSDVNFVYWLSKKGTCLVNWAIQCGHLLDDGTILYPDGRGQIGYIKKNGEWIRYERET